MQKFTPIPVAGLAPDAMLQALRLNSLGSLYYFVKVALHRTRLTDTLHLPFCQALEREHLKDVIEMPRDHFKSTCASEGLPMWRTLPLAQHDIDSFAKLGYDDAFIRWMTRAHDPNLRNLLVAENITNAAKLGRRIRWHFESNAIYRTLFSETLPDTSCTWTDFSLHIKRPQGGLNNGGAHGEGTFDFMGVGSALQSRHYNGLVNQDDLVGRKAVESQSVMDKTIEYHQLLTNATDSTDPVHECDELVVGNRWSYNDLNSHMREHETEFRFESHSALGGCCPTHPPDTPIFPEEFSHEKLEKRRRRLGMFNFSCQFLNNPSAPENADFRVEWLQYFRVVYDPSDSSKWKIVHEVRDGIVLSDINRRRMSIAMTADPNHSGNTGRCRHAIVVLGVSDAGNYYLLDTWAQSASYDVFYNQIFKMAEKWCLHRIGLETIAAQRYVKHHLETLAHIKNYRLTIDELKGEVDAPDGTTSRKKEWRIRNVIAPIAERFELWIQRHQVDFTNEYQTFPKGKFVDQLDALAYAPQLVRKPLDEEAARLSLEAFNKRMQEVGRPYSYGYGRIHAS